MRAGELCVKNEEVTGYMVWREKEEYKGFSKLDHAQSTTNVYYCPNGPATKPRNRNRSHKPLNQTLWGVGGRTPRNVCSRTPKSKRKFPYLSPPKLAALPE